MRGYILTYFSLEGTASVSQMNIVTVSKAKLGKLLRDGVERIWALPSAYILFWTEQRYHLEPNIDTILNRTELNWMENLSQLWVLNGGYFNQCSSSSAHVIEPMRCRWDDYRAGSCFRWPTRTQNMNFRNHIKKKAINCCAVQGGNMHLPCMSKHVELSYSRRLLGI